MDMGDAPGVGGLTGASNNADTGLPSGGEGSSAATTERTDPDNDVSIISEQTLRDESSFLADVTRFYDQSALSDVTLHVGGRQYHAHRFVLAKSSEVFRAMLYEPAWSRGAPAPGAAPPVEQLNETPECEAVFDRFLRYLYTSEVRVDTKTAVGVLCLADKYQVESLRRLCTSYMVAESASPRLHHALTWYVWGKLLNLPELRDQCARTISWNYQRLMLSDHWLETADVDFLADTLASSALVVSREHALFEALSAWLLHERHRSSLAEFALRLLPLIRFSQMTVIELHALERSELAAAIAEPPTGDSGVTSGAACGELFQSLLSRAYRFHALCTAVAALGIRFSDDPWTTPRDYTDLAADFVRTHSTLRIGIQVDVKVPRGPAPGGKRDADWKITYRKTHTTDWTIQLYPHDTATAGAETYAQTSILLYDQHDRVIQVHRAPTCACARGSPVLVNVHVEQPALVCSMAVLIKPMPS